MATKKTVKKVLPVVKATPEVQEVRADGEYNKYPVYHGCIRFDDDNIVEVNIINGTPSFKYNGEEIKESPAYLDDINTLIKISNDKTMSYDSRKELIYTEAEFNNYIAGARSTWSIISSLTRAVAIVQEMTTGFDAATLRNCDLWFNVKPHTTYFFYPSPSSPQRINIHFCFDSSIVTEDELTAWGLTGSAYHITYNEKFPTRDEFFEMYGG